MFATVERSLPTISATSCCVSAKSLMSCSYPSASSIGLRSERCRFSTSASESSGDRRPPSRSRGSRPLKALRGAEASLASDQLVPLSARRRSHRDGLEQAVHAKRRFKVRELLRAELLAGLQWIRAGSPRAGSGGAGTRSARLPVVRAPSRVAAEVAPSSRVGDRVSNASSPRPSRRPLSAVIISQLHDSFVSALWDNGLQRCARIIRLAESGLVS